jgi:hypothetical protein
MKAGIFLVGLLFLFTSSAFSKNETSNKEIINTIKSYIPAITEAAINTDNLDTLFGHYSSKPFTRDRPGLSGEELYLFPDKTFYYLEWADVLPLTIYDIGTWDLKDGILELKSDGIITWKQSSHRAEQRKYLPMYFIKNSKKILLLMGIDWDFPYFNEHAGKDTANTDYEWMLDINTLNKTQDIGLSDYKKLKEKLFKECWHPDWFTKTASPVPR